MPEPTAVTMKALSVNLARTYEMAPKTAEVMVRDLMEQIAKNLLDGKVIKLDGIGKLSPKTVPAHEARHPGTGETVAVPERKKLIFKPSIEIMRVLAPSKYGYR